MNTTSPPRWQPVLTGDVAGEARAAVEAIAKALRVDPTALEDPSLSRGAAGRAMFFSYLAKVWPDRGFEADAARYLERAIDLLAEMRMNQGFYSGFIGVAWVAEHLQNTAVDVEDDDPNLELDEALRDYLSITPWANDYDLVSGLAGCGVYALERMPRAIAVENIARIVDRLSEQAVPHDDGITWLRKPAFLLPETRELYPLGYYDLGLAHGVPALIAVLAGAIAAGVSQDKALPLLEGAWRWMMTHRLPTDAETTFSYTVDGPRPGPARSAWCYGDPGVAMAMFAASKCVGNEAWANEALAIARRAAARPGERSGCVDAGLCHGAAGLALIYHRFWCATGESTFADAARFWYQKTLEMRQPEKGIAGFQAYYPRTFGEYVEGLNDDATFLTGALGIGLALLSGISAVEPAWDRVLLTSLRPMGSGVAR